MRQIFILMMSVLILGLGARAAEKEKPLTNFAHLEHLMEEIRFEEEPVSIVHIYANYPDYQWVGAAESGPEGIACVDDAARAAVVFLRHFELTGEKQSWQRAQGLLRFVARMQTDDGEFYNFVLADHSINKSGRTSYKSFGWWGARGLWALAAGCRIGMLVDPGFAAELRERVNRSLPNVRNFLANYDRDTTIGGLPSATWLPYGSGADVTSELVLGLLDTYRVTHDTTVRSAIVKFSKGMMLMQDGDAQTFPYAMHRSWETLWHMWGNGQSQALASAGKLLGDSSMIGSAEREAIGFYSRLLIDGFLKEIDVSSRTTTVFEQIAYGVRPMAIGLLRLYEANRKPEYLKMAGLAGAWLFGNNDLRQQMYDPSTGRCFDGIRDSATINKNSGAESTIEALATVLELERYPIAKGLLYYRRIASGSSPGFSYALFRGPAGKETTLLLDLRKSRIQFLDGSRSREFWMNPTHRKDH